MGTTAGAVGGVLLGLTVSMDQAVRVIADRCAVDGQFRDAGGIWRCERMGLVARPRAGPSGS